MTPSSGTDKTAIRPFQVNLPENASSTANRRV